MISDGSELLLLVPSMAGIVGSVVLPVLGAVPDGAIVVFSGMCVWVNGGGGGDGDGFSTLIQESGPMLKVKWMLGLEL